jgi:viroplasmin and RNaseH domain-containing protein
MQEKYYAVITNHKCKTVFGPWDYVKKLIHKRPGAYCKGFKSKGAADSYVDQILFKRFKATGGERNQWGRRASLKGKPISEGV